ncbi:hypothetical protein MKX03_004920 [Papaver bracteatum]|nr:hypothetical protein MKX03_004920 [Papaver bracteatum]
MFDPKKKKKSENSSKDGAKGGPSKVTKSDSTKFFRVDFGHLHDLFHDLENKGLMSKELIAALEKTPFRDML